MIARLLEAKGGYSSAEAAYRKSHALWTDALAKSSTWPTPPPRMVMELAVNLSLAFEGRTKIAQGRHAEGEADIRKALLSHLKIVGKYSPDTPTFINFLAKAIMEQGRYQESEKLSRASVDIFEALGYQDNTQAMVGSLALLVGALSLQQKYQEERKVIARIDAATKDWEPARIAALRLDPSRALMEYFAGDVETGIAIARDLAARVKERVGELHPDHAMARGVLAVGLARAGRHTESLREFRAAIPILISVSRENEDDDQSVRAARDHRLGVIVEHYMTLLALAPSTNGDVATESFRLADIVRGRSVQKALSASSARA
jgi:hypothetical protein